MTIAHATESRPAQDVPWVRPMQVIGPPDGQESAVPRLRLVTLVTPRVIELRQPQAVIGRQATADLQILQGDVSRQHARLFHADKQWHIEDLGSMNGVTVNGVRVQNATLQHNDVIGVASHLYQIDLGSARAGQPPVTDEERTRNILRSIAAVLPGGAPQRKSA